MDRAALKYAKFVKDSGRKGTIDDPDMIINEKTHKLESKKGKMRGVVKRKKKKGKKSQREVMGILKQRAVVSKARKQLSELGKTITKLGKSK